MFGTIEVRVLADPERASHGVRIQRRLNGGDWETVRTDRSSPVDSYFQDLSDVPVGTTLQYRAILSEPDGTRVVSDPHGHAACASAAGGQCDRGRRDADGDRLLDRLGSRLCGEPSHVRHRRLRKGTFPINGLAGTYGWKVAINDSWDVNYGGGGAAGGSNIVVEVPAGTTSITLSGIR